MPEHLTGAAGQIGIGCFMFKLFVLAICIALACTGSSAIADPVACKDCKTDSQLTIREQIKADRARDVERVAKESAERPWDVKDTGHPKREPSSR
jgi:hypothetical protein